MSDADAFLRAIADAPEDDAPPLVFADWLDEHGDHARAEFIRVQCAAEAWPFAHPERKHLSKRADELLREHRSAWDVDLHVAGAGPWSWFERGFVAGVVLEVPELLANLARLTNLCPPIDVMLNSLTIESATTLAGMPELARLRGLNIRFGDPDTDDPNLIPLLRSPYLTGLVRFDCAFLTGAGPAEAQGVADWPSLPSVRELGVPAAFGLAGIEAILRSLDDGSLRSLTVTCREDDPLIVPALLAWPGLTGLRSLTLDSDVADAEVRELAAFGQSTALESLFIDSRCRRATDFLTILASPTYRRLRTAEFLGAYDPEVIDDRLPTPVDAGPLRRLAMSRLRLSERAAWLADLPRLAGIEVLMLPRCGLTDTGVQSLARSPNLAEVRTLHLGENEVSAVGWRALAVSPYLAQLQSLNLRDSQLDMAGMAALTEAGWIATLGELGLESNPLSEAMIRELASAPLNHLHTLNLARTDLTANGLRTLLAGQLPSLQSLTFATPEFRSAVGHVLADWPGLATLREMNLGGWALDQEGLRTLAASPFLGSRCTLTLLGTGVSSEVIGLLRERVGCLIVR